MAASNHARPRPQASLSHRAVIIACEFFVAAIVMGVILAWFSANIQAADIGPSELTIRAPGVSTIPTTVRAGISPAPKSPAGVQHAFQPFAAAAGATRGAPVVQLAQPIANGVGSRMAIRQSNQEPIPPGAREEYLRGTGVPPIGSLTINTQPNAGRVPAVVDRIQSMEGQLGPHEYRRDWLNYSYRWDAPGFYNKPLYFEQVNLERYGYNWGALQPFVSGAQFFVKIPLLPYAMTVHRPCECVYSLGYYRPGSCVPYQFNWPDVRPDAVTVEGAFIVGLCFLIP